MSSTTYTDYVGPAVNAAWLNDVNTATYKAILNVKSAAFGAKGDGVTDDTAAIQAAIAYAGSLLSGASVFFPDGSYLISSTINIATNNVTLVGASKDGTHIIRNSAFGTAFNFTTGSATLIAGVGISNMSMSDNGASGTTGTWVNVNNVSRFTFSNVTMFGGTNGVLMLGTSNVQINQFQFYALGGSPAGRYGIEIGVSTLQGIHTVGGNIHINNCDIYGGDTTAGTYSYLSAGLYITGGDGIFVNNFYAGGTSTGDVQVNFTDATVTCGNIIIDNSFCDICRGNGILINGTQTVSKFSYNGTVDCNNSGQPGMDGVNITAASNVLLKGLFRGWAGNGIHLATGVNSAIVSGSRCPANGGYGIQLDSGTNNLTVVGNDVGANTTGPLLDNSGAVTKTIAKNTGYNPIAPTNITVTASPFTYTNLTGDTVVVFVNGGTVSGVTSAGLVIGTATNLSTTVPYGQSVVVTYSAAPTMKYLGT